MTLGIDSTDLIYLVLGPGLLFLGALLLRLDLRLQSRCDELGKRVAEAETRLQLLANADDRGAYGRQIEERVALLSRQQEQLMLRDSETGPYFQAIRHAENGANVDALIERTGVTRAEAELIHALHGKTANTAASD
jgi:Protein of unknown function (DUF2802)